MKNNESSIKLSGLLRLAIAMMLTMGILWPTQIFAQLPPRFYWKTLSGGYALPLIINSISGNTNPFNPAHDILAGANVDATLVLSGFAHTFSLLDRAAMAAFIMPMGRISGEVTVAGKAYNQSASGFGDPMLEFNINLIGPRAQKNIPDAVRYEPGFSIDLLADLAIPVGEYDSDQPLNLGLNRWYGRLGVPIIWQLGPWVPGRRTTLEFLPVVWLFGTNDDYVGQTMSTDPMIQLDSHFTHDFTEHCFASIDSAWFTGGEASISGTTGESLNNLAFGFTFGYSINDNLNITAGYKSTVNDNDSGDMRMDGSMISFVYGWHPLIEGMNRLKGE